eukprot:TRINITY_DN5212_c0_g1_i2.p1 TRINITY_DN5212_c0_g1~~TRINITY_DN5212_c0_g1_i2.p1  ORF type:complete len:527 (-),score=191.75 TRINITY_DN5212_c0_g1_i2:57-1568(-)
MKALVGLAASTVLLRRSTRSAIVIVSGSSSLLCSSIQRQRRCFRVASRLDANKKKTQEFLLAAVGEGIAEVEVIQYHVKVGDVVQQFDKVLDVQTDKATVEITSRYDGVVKSLNYQPGQIAKVGSSLITLETDSDAGVEKDDDAADAADETPKKKSAPVAAVSAGDFDDGDDVDDEEAVASEKFLMTPAVRRIAKEHSVNLKKITASGPGGRILKEDILKHLKISSDVVQSTTPAKRPATSAPVPTTSSAPAKSASAPILPAPLIPSTPKEDTVHQITGIQRIMVKSMNASLSVPALGLSEEIHMDNLIRLRGMLKSHGEKHNVKITFLPILIKAVSQALKHYPSLNAHVNDDCSAVTIKAAMNIGLAMDTPRGLLVPNIKNCEDKSILEIAADLNRLQVLGSEGKLGKEELTGGTFTLSNIGSIGGTYCAPIIVVPQVVIGAFGRIQHLPRYNSKGDLHQTSCMAVSWSADHRVVDGATITRFSNLFKHYVEHPELMLLDTR